MSYSRVDGEVGAPLTDCGTPHEELQSARVRADARILAARTGIRKPASHKEADYSRSFRHEYESDERKGKRVDRSVDAPALAFHANRRWSTAACDDSRQKVSSWQWPGSS
jgi:hypothetical protein